MSKSLILATQEKHDPERQRILMQHAQQITARLRKQRGVLGVTLSNSVAQGPVSEASDLDLHVIVSDQFEGSLPQWAFYRKRIIENFHIVHEAQLRRGWRVRHHPDALAPWFHRTILGEFLHRFLPLWWNPDTKWEERLPVLISLRQNREVSERVAGCYLRSASRYLTQALHACDYRATYDSHQYLRQAFRAALNAALVHRGWTLRGSKKSIEIAQAFLPDPLIESVLAIGFDIVGLTELTPDQARKLCQARFAYRKTYLHELYRIRAQYAQDEYILHKLDVVIRGYGKHNTGAFDYYSALLDQKMFLGPINHIRCFSGLMYLPGQLLSCLRDGKTRWPVQEFVGLDVLSPAIRSGWLDLMGLTDSRERCLQLASVLTRSLKKLGGTIRKSI